MGISSFCILIVYLIPGHICKSFLGISVALVKILGHGEWSIFCPLSLYFALEEKSCDMLDTGILCCHHHGCSTSLHLL